MRYSLLDFFFPQICCICKRHGHYICTNCKKLLKRNLPECYICRRLSPTYSSHICCKKRYSLDNVYVAWEYNHMSSSILKLYKYKYVRDIAPALTELFLDTICKSTFRKNLKEALLVPVPISGLRRKERGFNQMDYIVKRISSCFCLDICMDLVLCRTSSGHQAGKSKQERVISKENPFYIKESVNIDIRKYKSITLVDDVITTGNTLETITEVLRNRYGADMKVDALCMFRGKPYFLPTPHPR